jgi:hypothetical protein
MQIKLYHPYPIYEVENSVGYEGVDSISQGSFQENSKRLKT